MAIAALSTLTTRQAMYPSHIPLRQVFYFRGLDLVLLVFIPSLQFVTFRMGVLQLVQYFVTFLHHLLFWRDATYELWDPLHWFWLYHVYVPMQLLSCMWTGRKWARADVSRSETLYD